MPRVAKVCLACGLALSFSGSIFAQARGNPAPVCRIMAGNGVVQTISGAPFSAIEELERTQTLEDGSHIYTKRIMHVYRDSQGRVRTENYRNMGGQEAPKLVTVQIADPVECASYELEVEDHIATRRAAPPFVQGAAPQSEAQPAPPPRPVPEELRPKSVSESAGTQLFDGISAQGIRSTVTFPVGSVGNDGPIVMVREAWTSAELGAIILNKVSDPRNADTVQRLTNIVRAEPDQALFRVPANYTLRNPQ